MPNLDHLKSAAELETLLLGLPPSHPHRVMLESAIALLRAAQPPAIDNTRTALIDKSYHWNHIDSRTPKGAKMQLIRREYGVAVYGVLGSREHFFTHWAPLPTFQVVGPAPLRV